MCKLRFSIGKLVRLENRELQPCRRLCLASVRDAPDVTAWTLPCSTREEYYRITLSHLNIALEDSNLLRRKHFLR
jgi:hypothetical protein